jgi:hypothetical protein
MNGRHIAPFLVLKGVCNAHQYHGSIPPSCSGNGSAVGRVWKDRYTNLADATWSDGVDAGANARAGTDANSAAAVRQSSD